MNRTEFSVLARADGESAFREADFTDQEKQALQFFLKEDILQKFEKPMPGSLRPDQMYYKYDNRFLQSVQWAITGRCNLRCKHCYMSAPEAKFGEPTLDQCMRVIDQLDKCGIPKIDITGGEPLVNPHFPDILRELARRGIKLGTLYTNAILVTEDLFTLLEEVGMKPLIRTSYDGVGLHDWFRGVPGSEAAVLRCASLCRAHGLRCSAAMSLHRKNKDLILETLQRFSEVGGVGLQVGFISDFGEWTVSDPFLRLTYAEYLQTLVDFIPKYFKSGIRSAIEYDRFFSYSSEQGGEIALGNSDQSTEKLPACASIYSTAHISPEGVLLPCVSLCATSLEDELPSVFDMDLADALENPLYVNLVNAKCCHVHDHNEKCRTCEHFKQCHGGCRMNAFVQGDWLGIDPHVCEFFTNGWAEKISNAAAPFISNHQLEILSHHGC